MKSFPQEGGCVCGDVRFVLREDPITVYACHCTDCQTETGSGFYLAVIVQASAFEYTRGAPVPWQVRLPDGREKGCLHCVRCRTNLAGPARDSLYALYGGVFDDTSWIIPAGHIWTRSAQPWVRIPEDSLNFETQPGDDGTLAMVRKWRSGA